MAQQAADGADGGRRLFRRWLGAHSARAVSVRESESDGFLCTARFEVARKWSLGLTLVNTVSPEETPEWLASRAAIEGRLGDAGLSIALFVPRNAPLPAGEPGISQIADAIAGIETSPDGRLELKREVGMLLRRLEADGSVITITGGLSDRWAQFTDKVKGTFHLDSRGLFRLPSDETEREAIFDEIVAACDRTGVDQGLIVPVVDAWTAVDLEDGGSCVIGTPQLATDESRAALRRNVRRGLQAADARRFSDVDVTALAVLGAETYAESERLSWVLRGFDPALYAGYDIIVVIADGVVRTVLEPAAGGVPWDA